jgi:DNA-binding PadR family transcriptional regulator
MRRTCGLPTVSALGYALLCLLVGGSSTGYDLASRLRRPVGYYWTARHSQIYPELARLVEAGLVDYETGSGPGPREKKTYTITALGRRALVQWLVRPPTPRMPKDELLLKTYAVAAAPPRRMARLYLDMADEYDRRLAHYRDMLADLTEDGAADRRHPKFGNYATLRLGVATEEERVAWCRWMASTLMGNPN